MAATAPGGSAYQDQATRDGRLQGALARIAKNDPQMAALLGLASPYGPLQIGTYSTIFEQNVASGDVAKILGGYNDVTGFQNRGVMTISLMINGLMSDNYVESIAYHELTHALNHFDPSMGRPGEFYAYSQQYAYEQKFFSSVNSFWATSGLIDRSGNFMSLQAYMGSQAAVSRGNPTGSTTLPGGTTIIRIP